MIRRVTPLAYGLATVLAWALLLGVLTGRAELFIAAAPLALGFLSARGPDREPRYRLHHEVSAERLAEGGRLMVTVRLSAIDPLPLIEILEFLPMPLELSTGNNRVVLGAAAGSETSWSYQVVCATRGRFSLGTFHLRRWERSGFAVAESREMQPKPVFVYPYVASVRRVPQPLHTQASFGNYVAPRLGDGIEPGDIRPFASGDRIRRVNWRASLRRGELYVTRFQEERNADVVLLLDAFADTGAHPFSVLDQCVRAAAALAAAYLGRKDRVGFVELSGFLRWVKPATGRRQNEILAEALLPAAAHSSYVVARIDYLPPRVLPPQALVIALSPLLDRRFINTVVELAARGCDVIILAVSPIEPTRRALSSSPSDDLALRIRALEWRVEIDALRRRGLVIAEWRADTPLESALARIRPRSMAGR